MLASHGGSHDEVFAGEEWKQKWWWLFCWLAMETAMVVGCFWFSMKTAMLSNSCWPAVETAMETGKCWRGVGAAVVVVQGVFKAYSKLHL